MNDVEVTPTWRPNVITRRPDYTDTHNTQRLSVMRRFRCISVERLGVKNVLHVSD